MKLIAGLGNPGLKYRDTRHNIGFLTIDNFAKAHKIKADKRSNQTLFGKLTIQGEEILLIKPQTYMNNSGDAVKAFSYRCSIKPNDILVVCDDIHLDLGILRLRAKGSSGGHKGLESIIERIGASDFNRLRIGIGFGRSDEVRDYVLSRFGPDEKSLVAEMVSMAADAVTVWIEGGIELAMNRYNKKNRDGGE